MALRRYPLLCPGIGGWWGAGGPLAFSPPRPRTWGPDRQISGVRFLTPEICRIVSWLSPVAALIALAVPSLRLLILSVLTVC